MLTIVAENLQPFDKRTRKAFELDKTALLSLLDDIRSRGVTHIDVNPGRLRRDKERIVRFFVETIEEHSPLTIIIDSADPDVVEIALKAAVRKPIINGFSLEEMKLEKILPLAAKYGTDIIGLIMHSTTIPVTAEEKFAAAEQMIVRAESAGVGRKQIILDPVILPLGWENGTAAARANIEFVKHVKELFGPDLRTMAGLSNLTTRSAQIRDSGFIQSMYCSILYQAGLDMVMLNVFNEHLMSAVRFFEVLAGNRVFALDELLP